MDTSMDISTTSPHPLSPKPALQLPGDRAQASGASIAESAPSPTHTKPASPPLEMSFGKRGLPESLSSHHPHGLITGKARSPEQQAALEARKAEIRATMTAEEIEGSYQETVKKVHDVLKEIKDGNEKIDKEIEDAKKTREMERRAWLGMKKAAAKGDI